MNIQSSRLFQEPEQARAVERQGEGAGGLVAHGGAARACKMRWDHSW